MVPIHLHSGKPGLQIAESFWITGTGPLVSGLAMTPALSVVDPDIQPSRHHRTCSGDPAQKKRNSKACLSGSPG